MKKILLFLIGLLICMPIEIKADSDRGSSRFKYGKGKDTGEMPTTPADIPLYYRMSGDVVTVFCEYDVMGIVTVSDDFGDIIAYDTVNLGEGYTVVLPADATGEITITVEINGEVYYAVI